jgi:hypothetical protein
MIVECIKAPTFPLKMEGFVKGEKYDLEIIGIRGAHEREMYQFFRVRSPGLLS